MIEKINENLNSAYENLDKIQRIQEQVDILNKGLNSCIEIVDSSIKSNEITEQLSQLGTDNEIIFKTKKNYINESYNDTKKKIYQLQEEKRALEEEEEKEKEKAENEEKK